MSAVAPTRPPESSVTAPREPAEVEGRETLPPSSSVTRVLAAIGAATMMIGVFVPFASSTPGFQSTNLEIIDLSDLSYFYQGLDLLVAACAAAVIPFVLRGALCGSVLITLGTLSLLGFVLYVVNPIRLDYMDLRPGGVLGIVGAILIIAAGVVAVFDKGSAMVATPPGST